MAEIYKPTSETELIDVVRGAAEKHTPLEVVGTGTKRGLGRPVSADYVVDMSGFSGIRTYEPEELVMIAGAGTPMTEITAALSQHGQMLAFEPLDHSGLLGVSEGTGTLGGLVGVGASGPRRFKAGGARDFVLGVKGVSGRVEPFKSGGRVVKNVTGYDMSKLITGSYGTLAALTEINLKLAPAPEKTYTLLVYGLDDAGAVTALRDAAQSSFEPSGLAYLPKAAAEASSIDYVREPAQTVTSIRVEGPGISVRHRIDALKGLIGEGRRTEELHSSRSLALWREIRDCAPLLEPKSSHIWRVSVAPSNAPALIAEVRPDAHYLDGAGGLIWFAFSAPETKAALKAAVLQQAVGRIGGHATLVRAPVEARSTLNVFQPQEPGLAGLTARVKESFDPLRILNPGRMYKTI